MTWLRKRTLLNKEVLIWWTSDDHMVSALSWPRIEAIRGSSPGTSKTFSHPESPGIISNLMITELFYLHTLSITRSSLHTRFFRSIHCSVCRYRFTKNGSTSPKSLQGCRETCPWLGTLCCFLWQGSLLSLCLSPPRSINGFGESLGKPRKLRGSDLRWTSIMSRGSRNGHS